MAGGDEVAVSPIPIHGAAGNADAPGVVQDAAIQFFVVPWRRISGDSRSAYRTGRAAVWVSIRPPRARFSIRGWNLWGKNGQFPGMAGEALNLGGGDFAASNEKDAAVLCHQRDGKNIFSGLRVHRGYSHG